MDSILDEIKKVCNVEVDDDSFDVDLLLAINSDFGKLNQLGAGPEDGFVIEDNTTVWSDFTADTKLLSHVKLFIKGSSRLKFDPPANGTLMEALKQEVAEAEWRIQMHVEGYV